MSSSYRRGGGGTYSDGPIGPTGSADDNFGPSGVVGPVGPSEPEIDLRAVERLGPDSYHADTETLQPVEAAPWTQFRQQLALLDQLAKEHHIAFVIGFMPSTTLPLQVQARMTDRASIGAQGTAIDVNFLARLIDKKIDP